MAIHEAGHAVVRAALLPGTLEAVSIRPGKAHSGVNVFIASPDTGRFDGDWWLNPYLRETARELHIVLAGTAAEQFLAGVGRAPTFDADVARVEFDALPAEKRADLLRAEESEAVAFCGIDAKPFLALLWPGVRRLVLGRLPAIAEVARLLDSASVMDGRRVEEIAAATR